MIIASTFNPRGGLSGTSDASLQTFAPAEIKSPYKALVPTQTMPAGTGINTISTKPTVNVIADALPGGAGSTTSRSGQEVPLVPGKAGVMADTKPPPAAPPKAAAPEEMETVPWPPPAEKKRWVPWAIGGSVVAAIGAAVFGLTR